jgi:uncharacterized protein
LSLKYGILASHDGGKMECEQKLKELEKKLSEKGKVLISYSGGLDSGFLAKVAHDVLGDNAYCVILDSETISRSEIDGALFLAKSLGINCHVVKYSVFDFPEFTMNSQNRCYLCKKQSSIMLKKVAKNLSIDHIADGVNISDYNDYRPGIKASDEEGIWHPFVDAGISKVDIRKIARSMGLSFWNKPSSACMSSRIPYGDRITEANLAMIECAEDYLKDQGIEQVRVRVHGSTARIEVLDDDFGSVLRIRSKVVEELKRIGFSYITLDLQGFRSGSMNEVI